VAPEERGDQRGAAVAASEEVGVRAGGEEQLGQVAVVGVSGLVELRPAVVVAAVGIRPALEQQRDERAVAGHAEQVVAVGPPLRDQLREPVEELDERLSVVVLDGSIGEHERRGRHLAGVHRLDVAAQLAPGGEAVAGGEVAASLGHADAAGRGDAVGAALVVVDVGPERLLEVVFSGHRGPCAMLAEHGVGAEPREHRVRAGERAVRDPVARDRDRAHPGRERGGDARA
jgi:hypothetical protein